MSAEDERARHDEYGRGNGDDNEHDQHAGNGIVNHGPSGNTGPEESGVSDTDGRSADRPAGASPRSSSPSDEPDRSAPSTRSAPSAHSDTEAADTESGDAGGFGPDIPAPGALGSDELALRRLLHQAVEEIEPTDGTLDHLRRAVPARRARKRQAVVGMAAAALFIGTAVPALIHVSNSTGPNADPSIAANASQTQGGANEGKQAGTGGGSGGSSGKDNGKDKDDKKDEPDKGKGSSSGTTGTEPSASAANVPACTSLQLGSASGSAGSPDAGGAVYGSFRVTNVSGSSCTVSGDGSVALSAVGAASQSAIGTALHATGDAAAGLPDQSTYAAALVLQPGSAYEVAFAWVPSSTCPTTGGSTGGEPSPDPTPTGSTGGDSGGTTSEGTSGVSSQLMKEDGTADGSVVVSYSAEGGGPTVSTTVSNACAGTVYRTGVLAGS
ncbi:MULTISPECIES: hypothetical protein [unclassified Streptomyces]|uniref:hypothetical protein n=1 Tax=unclassified Streptomyces TaxID=2593676 RepID=UPI00117E6F23|nr:MULTISPECIES: hypothetical protein [unclassified Streptomyces]TRO61654.1 hypothetical protein E4K73_25400 [Streptomyces sp. IB201691-2A2]